MDQGGKMETSIIDGIFTLKLNAIQTITLAVMTYYFGVFVRNRVAVLKRLSIPAPVIGGMLFALIVSILRSKGVIALNLDTTLQTALMTIFFSTIGFGDSLTLIKKGGKPLVIFFVLAIIVAFAQNIIGIALAKIAGVHPVLGIIGGAVSLMGGLGTGGAFGPYFENLGVSGATAAAIACATFGMAAGSLMGAPFGEFLIRKYKITTRKSAAEIAAGSSPDVTFEDAEAAVTSQKLLSTLGLVLVAVASGAFLSLFLKDAGMTLPVYIGAMMAGAVVRNLCDLTEKSSVDMDCIEVVSNITLALYLTMAINNLKLWELVNLAVPLMIILIGQVIFIGLFAWLVVYFVMGRDYEAVQMSVGMIGFGLGAMPNALVNMAALSEKYGYARQAYILVSLVGAFLIDFVNALLITWMGGWFV